MKTQIQRVMLRFMNADAVCSFSYGRYDGRWRTLAIEGVGDTALVQHLTTKEGQPLAQDVVPPLWLSRTDTQLFESLRNSDGSKAWFERTGALFDTTGTSINIYDRAHLLFREGNRCVGGFVAFRFRQPGFSQRELRRYDRFIEPLQSMLRLAEQEVRNQTPSVLFMLPNGTVDASSSDLSVWLTKERREALAALVRRGSGASALMGIYCANVVCLDGRNAARYVVTMTPVERPLLSSTPVLTPRQGEVAEYAAAGATAVEIARFMKISPQTVRYHLKAVYRRFGINSRLELNSRMNHEYQPTF